MSEVCRFFLQGKCKFGDSCKNLHPGAGGGGGPGRGGGGGSGEVCRFFLQGRCKFGDSCKNLHPGAGGGGGGGSSWRGGGGGGRHQPDPRVDTGRGWNQRQGGNLFRYLNDSSGSGSTGSGYNSGSRFGQNYRDGGGGGGGGQRSPNAFGSNTRYSNTGSRDSGFRSGGGGGFGSRGWSNSGGSGYGRNPFDSRGTGGSGGGGGGGGGGRYYQQQSSTDSGVGTAEPITARDVAEVVQQDMNNWPTCGMWPLSCYACKKDSKCLPGFNDISPEELRWEAYQANLSGKFESYVQTIHSLGEAQMKTWREYGTITEQDASKLLSAESEPLSLFGSSSSRLTSATLGPSGALFGSGAGGKQTSTPGSLFGGSFGSSQSGGQGAGSLFGSSSGLLREGTGLFGQTTTAQQQTSFQLGGLGSNTGGPALTQGSQPFQPLGSTSTGTAVLSDGTTDSGASQVAAEEQLTEEELDAFKADKFVLGLIPEHPPPAVLC